MAAPKTRNWSALENAHKPKGLHLLVPGRSRFRPQHAAEASPRIRATPRCSVLKLTIVDDPDEPSGDAMVWRCANYHEEVKVDQYTSVVICWTMP